MTKLFLSWINLQSFFYSLVASKLESFAVVAKSLHNSGISSKWRHAGLICNIIWLDFPISFMPRNCSDNFWANRVSFHVSVKFCIILDSVLNALSRCVLWCLSLYSDAKIFIQCLMVSLPGQTEWNKNILRTQTFTPQLHFYQYLSIIILCSITNFYFTVITLMPGIHFAAVVYGLWNFMLKYNLFMMSIQQDVILFSDVKPILIVSFISLFTFGPTQETRVVLLQAQAGHLRQGRDSRLLPHNVDTVVYKPRKKVPPKRIISRW